MRRSTRRRLRADVRASVPASALRASAQQAVRIEGVLQLAIESDALVIPSSIGRAVAGHPPESLKLGTPAPPADAAAVITRSAT